MCGGGGKGSQGGGGVGALGWGGLAPAQQQTIQASPEALGWYRQAMQLGQQAVSRPYQQFGTTPEQFVAQLTPTQQEAISNISGTQGMAQPFYQAAAGVTGQALAPSYETVGRYMTPYMGQVVDPVRQGLQQQQAQQLAQQQSEAIRGGAFGGERAGLQRQALRGQQNLAMGQALSPLYQTGYGQALQAAQQQQQAGLQGAQQLAGLGTAAQQAALQQAQAQLGAGTLQQQTSQAGIDALRQQFQQQQMFPYMQAQFLSGLAGGLGPLLGQQTYQARAMSPFGSFFADGGAVDGDDDAARMGGAVTQSGDYYAGGIAPMGYANGGVSYAGDDISDILKSQSAMYGKEPKTEEMPTGEVKAAQGLVAPNLTSEEQKKTGLRDITGAAKDILGIGKDIYGMFSGKSSDESEKGGMGSRAEEDSSSGMLKSLGKLGLSAAANYVLPGSGFLTGLFADGGSVGYADGGNAEDDIFERGLLGAESARRQFDKFGRTITSPKGAEGIAQIMPGTAPEAAKLAGLKYDPERVRSDEAYNKALGRAYYDEQLRKFGTPELALAAYNAGPGRVSQALKKAGPGGDVMALLPAETRAYVPRALGLAGVDADKAIREARGLDRGYRAQANLPNEGETVDLESKTAGVKPSDEEGLGLNRQTIIPALVGLGSALEGIVGAKTVSPGAAIAAGLGSGLVSGGKSYMEVGKQIPEIRKLAAEAATAEQETKAKEQLVKKMGYETYQEYMRAVASSTYKNAAGVPIVRLSDGSEVPYYAYAQNPSKYPPPISATIQAPTIGGAQVGTPGAVPPTRSLMPDVTEVTAPQGVNFDPRSRSMARSEFSVLGTPGESATTARGSEYRSTVDKAAEGAQAQKLILNDVGGIISEAAHATGMNAPGAAGSTRAMIVNYGNTIARSAGFGYNYFGSSDNNVALLSKLNTLAGQRGVEAAQQTALGSLAKLVEAQPNLDQPPYASTFNAASNMVNNQMKIDQRDHADAYGQASGGLYGRAAVDFKRTNTPAKYRKEQDVLQTTMWKDPEAFNAMVSGKIDPAHIEQYFKDPKHGGIVGMSRYFGGE